MHGIKQEHLLALLRNSLSTSEVGGRGKQCTLPHPPVRVTRKMWTARWGRAHC